MINRENDEDTLSFPQADFTTELCVIGQLRRICSVLVGRSVWRMVAIGKFLECLSTGRKDEPDSVFRLCFGEKEQAEENHRNVYVAAQ